MITICEYQVADWNAICTIHDLARPDELRGSCDPRAFIPIEENEEVEKLKRCRKLIADKDEVIVGFVDVYDDYIAWLYVHPDYYGQGVGRALLQAGLKLAGPTACTIMLSENHPAFSIYNSEGINEVPRFENDNADYPCTRLSMEWNTQ